MKIIVATGNQGKVAEFNHILQGVAEFSSAKELGITEFPPEDGDTYEANALIKARFVMAQTNLPAIADDSGLEVDALDGAPGLYSARYGNKANDAERTAYLLEQLTQQLAKHPNKTRTARFCSSIAFVLPNSQSYTFFATTEGEITTAPKGEGGFGYDPVFLSADLGKTFAEATQEEKKSVSHRGRALKQFVEWLKSAEGQEAIAAYK